MPRTCGEDATFRRRLRTEHHTVVWLPCWTRVEEPDDPRRPAKSPDDPDDVLRVCAQEEVTSDGYRLLWLHSQRKAALDAQARGERCQRAIQELQELQARLSLPRTRFRDRERVEQAVRDILAAREVESLLSVEILQHLRQTFRKEGPGRPSQDSHYRREVSHRFELHWRVADGPWRIAEAEDGVFPLPTNDRRLTPRELLEAYKRQPKIEERFSQLKSDFDLAPVFLKTPECVVGLFTIYYLALLVRVAKQSVRRTIQSHDRAIGQLDLHARGIRPRRRPCREAHREESRHIGPLH